MTRPTLLAGLIVFAATVTAAAIAPQNTAAPAGTLTIAGDVTRPSTFTLADLKGMPRTSVPIPEEGRTVNYEGVLAGEILRRAGAPVGGELRGTALTTYVLATAKDGYQVVYSLGELDNGMSKNDIIIADSVDGKPLFDYQGPFRLVAPRDSRPARGVRMLEKLEVVRLKK